MNPVIAEMLLKQMNESKSDITYYRGQRVSRLYLRRLLWRANCNEDHRRAMRNAGKVLTI